MYKTINGWTKQSMIAHIKKEFKGKSVNDGESFCMYRGPGDRKCAVGMFIPDDKYLQNMEGCSYISKELDSVRQYMPLDRQGMSRLQDIHDGSRSSRTLQDMLEWIEKNVEGENV